MIKVVVYKTSNYPVSTPSLKRKVRYFLAAKGIKSDTEVFISFVSKPKMIQIARKYLKEESVHNVFSFTEKEVVSPFIYPPNNFVQLGEVVICYPKAFEEAKKENLTLDEKIWQLVEHGLMHLLGYHHK